MDVRVSTNREIKNIDDLVDFYNQLMKVVIIKSRDANIDPIAFFAMLLERYCFSIYAPLVEVDKMSKCAAYKKLHKMTIEGLELFRQFNGITKD